MLERYFKTKEAFNKFLDQNYDPETFEKDFTQFLNSLLSEFTTH